MGADQTNPMSFFKVHPSITGIVALNNLESSTQTFVWVIYIYIYMFISRIIFLLTEDWVLKKNNILLLLNVIFKKSVNDFGISSHLQKHMVYSIPSLSGTNS